MTGISRGRRSPASWRHRVAIALSAVACGLSACGRRPGTRTTPDPSAGRVVMMAAAIVLETAGPPPSDTAVSFTTGLTRTIVLRHGPPENVVFAEVDFPPKAFDADSGLPVQVELHPRPGVYGLEVMSTLPLRGGATITFKYPRYFSAPARARQAFGTDVLFERALAVGQVRPDGQLALLPSTRPASDNLRSALPAPGIYLVAAAR